jgi:hypothetical protein
MAFAALFLIVLSALVAAALGRRPAALAAFAVSLCAAVLTYLHHATDVLKLSF